MRNLAVYQDSSVIIDAPGAADIKTYSSSWVVAIAHDFSLKETYLLCNTGVVHCVALGDNGSYSAEALWSWNLNNFVETENEENEDSTSAKENDCSWFSITLVADVGSLVCLSHSGNIMSIKEGARSGDRSSSIDHEGVIDEGILDAKWNPDQTVLVIATRASTLIAMSSTWEVVFESPIDQIDPAHLMNTRLCWSGDAEYFTLLSTDSISGTAKLRYFSKSFESLHQGRHVAEGAAGQLKGLGAAVGCSNSGVMVAVPMFKARKWTICLLERNGLSHGGFDLQPPSIPAGYGDWQVHEVHFDLPSTLIALSLRSIPTSASANQTQVPASETDYFGVVQVYYRSNYHWYLKQEFRGDQLFCLGFDFELSNRLYLSAVANKNGAVQGFLRTIDLSWDSSCTSTTPECWAMVVDGKNIKGTPLAVATVPPPMCHTTVSPELAASCKAISMWSMAMPSTLTGEKGCGVACLCSDDSVRFYLVSPSGDMLLEQPEVSFISLPLNQNCSSSSSNSSSDTDSKAVEGYKSSISLVNYRSLKAIANADGRSVSLLVLGNRFLKSENSNSADVLLVYNVTLGDGLSEGSIKLSFEYKNTVISERHSIANLAICPPRLVIEESDRSLSSHNDSGGDVVAIGLRQAGGDEIDHNEMMACIYLISELETAGDAGLGGIEPLAQYLLPECCPSMAVLSTTSDDFLQPDNQQGAVTSEGGGSRAPMTTTVVGLSTRQKLFCGEFLLANAVTSFISNDSLRALLFITGGTKSHLNCVSHAGLLSLDPLCPEEQPVIELGEPRPVERGARLVASVNGSPKVVIQLPRGNLEAFEPRPLVLMRMRSLLDAHQYFKAIELVRKQRIDMNLLVDHSPSQFLLCLPKLVDDTLKVNPEFLSLLVAALDDGDITQTKYPPPSNYKRGGLSSASPLPLLISEEQSTPSSAADLNFSGLVASLPSTQSPFDSIRRNKAQGEAAKPRKAGLGVPLLPSQLVVPGLTHPGDVLGLPPLEAYAASGGKINYMCRWIRWALQKSQMGVELTLNPSLCVLTRQSPPRLREAVVLAKVTSKGLSQLHAAIKYLAFLVSNEKLFNTAFAECDFEMARLIARQGQMDPKEFNPLLERFESIAKGHSEKSVLFYLMKFQIQVHLHRSFPAIESGICFLNSINRDSLPSLANVDFDDLESTLHRLVKSTNCFEDLLPVLSSICTRTRKEFNNSSSSSSSSSSKKSSNSSDISKGDEAVYRVYQQCLSSYADLCSLSSVASEQDRAISAFLSLSPPRAHDAIRVAKLAGQWTYAIAIASMHANATTDIVSSSSSSSSSALVSPTRVAQEIVSEFKEGLEQGEFSDDIGTGSSGIGGGGSSESDNSKRNDEYLFSRSVEVSRLAVDYCDDVESAVAVLMMAKHWKEAIRLAVKQQRFDLLHGDIAEALRHDAKETLKLIKKSQKRLGDLGAELNELWQDAEGRLQLVSQADPALLLELSGGVGDDGKDGSGATNNNNDVASEYSAVSRASQLSYVSKASKVSKTSQQSGMSHVSVLSASSQKSSSQASTASKVSSFAVEGLQHALLSRGSADTPSDGNGRRGDKGKDKRRGDPNMKGKKGGRGEDKQGDPLGLKKEGAICEEFVGIVAWFSRLTRPTQTGIMRNLVESLVILQASPAGKVPEKVPDGDLELAASLQEAVDYVALLMQQLSLPLAPRYAPKWLASRNMEKVAGFQQPLPIISASQEDSSQEGQGDSSNSNVSNSLSNNNNNDSSGSSGGECSSSRNPAVLVQLSTCVDDWLKSRKLVLL